METGGDLKKYKRTQLLFIEASALNRIEGPNWNGRDWLPKGKSSGMRSEGYHNTEIGANGEPKTVTVYVNWFTRRMGPGLALGLCS